MKFTAERKDYDPNYFFPDLMRRAPHIAQMIKHMSVANYAFAVWLAADLGIPKPGPDEDINKTFVRFMRRMNDVNWHETSDKIREVEILFRPFRGIDKDKIATVLS